MKVVNLKFKNNKVEIVCEDKSIFISKENYIENPVSIGSFVDEKKVEFLLKQERVIESKIELIKLLNRKSLTEQEIVYKLKSKGHENSEIVMLIDSLRRSGLINDEYCGMLIVENLFVRRKGKQEILKVLNEKGISDEVSNKLIEEIDEDDYINNFNKVCDKYLKMYSSKPSKIKFQLVKNKLKEYGYEKELIDKLIVNKDESQDLVNAKKVLTKLLKNKNIDLDNYENVNKIKTKLVMKGFNYDIINLALEEVIDNEIN